MCTTKTERIEIERNNTRILVLQNGGSSFVMDGRIILYLTTRIVYYSIGITDLELRFYAAN